MAEDQILKPAVLSHEKIHFETSISGNGGGGGDDGCGDDGGGGDGWPCYCITIVKNIPKINELPGRDKVFEAINSIGPMLLKTSEGRYLLKRFYETMPKISSLQDQEVTLASILKVVKLFQEEKIDEAKSFFNQELTKFELSTL
jgi:hypothetical protein